MYLWRDSYVRRHSYKEFTYTYGEIHRQGGIHIRKSYVSRRGFLKTTELSLARP